MDNKDSPYQIPIVYEKLNFKSIEESTLKSSLTIDKKSENDFEINIPDLTVSSLFYVNFVFLKSEKNIYIFSVTGNKNGKKNLLRTANWFKKGSKRQINTKTLKTGIYQIGEYNSQTNDIKISNVNIKI